MRFDVSQAWATAQRLLNSFVAAVPRVLAEAKRRLQAAGIDLPYPTRQILFH